MNEMKTVDIPSDYFFRMATRDYYQWRSALIREFIQNSVDAGATEIHFDHNGKLLTVRDNGSGMNRKTIESALLTLGGSYKEGLTVGGMGKAKELLYFSWPSWEIKSQNCYVKGSGPRYEIRATEFIDGTISRIKIGDQFNDLYPYIGEYLKLSSLRAFHGIKCFFNGKSIEVSEYKLIKKIYTIDGLGDLYKVDTDDQTGRVIVQTHGLFMFNCHSVIDRTYLFNITQPSYNCLTSNRDGFAGEWQDKFTKMIGKVAIDSESTNLKKEIVIQVQALTRTETIAAPPAIVPGHAGHHPLTESDNDPIKKGHLPPENPSNPDTTHLVMTQNILDKNTQRKIKTGTVEKIRITKAFDRCLRWYRSQFSEGFMIVTNQEITSDFVCDLFHIDTLKMAHLWKAVVDHVASKSGITKNYGYGMVLDTEMKTLAECRDGFILFNPYPYHQMGWEDVPLDMVLSAAEELTHYKGYLYHNESFKCRYSEILGKALDGRIDVGDLMNVMRKVRKNG